MNLKTSILKSILYFSMFFMFLNACKDKEKSEVNCQKSPDDSHCIEEQKRKAEKQQAQQTKKFKNIGDCLKAKKAEAGVDPKSKPTVQMLKECKN